MTGRATSTWLGVLLRALLAAGSAAAQDEAPDAGAAAQAASAVLDAECTDVAGGAATTSANALVVVGPVLAQVSRTYDETKDPVLLYWRGALTSCIGQEDRAIEDLTAFVAAVEDQPGYADQVRDARRRLQRLTASSPRPTAVVVVGPRPSPAGPILMAAGGAALGAGLGVSIGSYSTGSNLLPNLGTTTGWDADIDGYTTAHAGERVGVAIVGVGSAVLTAGLVVALVDAANKRRGAR